MAAGYRVVDYQTMKKDGVGGCIIPTLVSLSQWVTSRNQCQLQRKYLEL